MSSVWVAMRSIDRQNWRRERGGHDLAGRIRRRSETRSWGYYRRQQYRQRRIPAQAGARMRSRPCMPASDHPGTQSCTSPSGLGRIVRRSQHRHWRRPTTSPEARVISTRRCRQPAALWRRRWQSILVMPARTVVDLEGGSGGSNFSSGCWIGSGRWRGMALGSKAGLGLRSYCGIRNGLQSLR